MLGKVRSPLWQKGYEGSFRRMLEKEMGAGGDALILLGILTFAQNIKSVFIEKLQADGGKDQRLMTTPTNFLLIARQGLSNASKFFDQEGIEGFIETTIKNL